MANQTKANEKTVYGVAKLGNTKTVNEDGSRKKSYIVWKDMIRRCYHRPNAEESKKHQSYDNVTVCERWLTFSNFERDIEKLEGYEKWLNCSGMSLDKDVKQPRCEKKIYSPDTCLFITQAENCRETAERKAKTYVSFDLKNDFKFEIHEGLKEWQHKQSHISKCVNHHTQTSCGRRWYRFEEAQELLATLYDKASQIDWSIIPIENYSKAYDMLREGDWLELDKFLDNLLEKVIKN